MNKKVLAAIVIVVVLALVIPIRYMFYSVYSWGADGELELTIELDQPKMDMVHDNSFSYTLKNTGDTDVRVLWGYSMTPFYIYDSNGTRVHWTGPEFEPPPPATNDDLIVLKAGGSKIRSYRLSHRDWAIESNQTYKLVAYYYCGEHSSISLPHWTGRVESNEVSFEVV